MDFTAAHWWMPPHHPKSVTQPHRLRSARSSLNGSTSNTSYNSKTQDHSDSTWHPRHSSHRSVMSTIGCDESETTSCMASIFRRPKNLQPSEPRSRYCAMHFNKDRPAEEEQEEGLTRRLTLLRHARGRFDAEVPGNPPLMLKAVQGGCCQDTELRWIRNEKSACRW